ncbi:hypothetical protein HALDL1_05150 [Halobacterium sp. DL1]|nr:hypothetical protein HALDL1_05150 [Halobacterium sp. DL1]
MLRREYLLALLVVVRAGRQQTLLVEVLGDSVDGLTELDEHAEGLQLGPQRNSLEVAVILPPEPILVEGPT